MGVPFITLPKGVQFQFPNTAENNYIDTFVNAKLKKLLAEAMLDNAMLKDLNSKKW